MTVNGEHLSTVDSAYSFVPEYDPSLTPERHDLTPEEIEVVHPTWMHGVRQYFEAAYPEAIAADELWPQQVDAMNAFRALLDKHVDDEEPTIRATLAHSMGMGKTVTMAKLIQLCGIGKPYNNRRLRAAFLAPEDHMLTNFIGRQDPAKPRGLALAAPELTASKWSDDHDTSGDVIAITLQSIVREAKKHLSGEESDFPFNEIDMFVEDEGDAVLTGETRAFIETFQKGRISICGTGTPEQKSGRSVFDLYPESLGRINFRESVEAYNVTKGRPVHFYTVSPGGKYTIEGLPEGGELSAEHMEALMAHENVRQFAVELAASYCEAGLQVAMYTHPGGASRSARIITERLNATTIHSGEDDERTIKAKAVGSFSSQSIQAIGDFSQRKLDVLLSSRLGEAGLDSPHLNVVICLAPTGSERRALQRTGRLVHNSEGGPLIVVFVAYDVADWHTGKRPSQLTPIQLFGGSYGHGKIAPRLITRGARSRGQNERDISSLSPEQYSYNLPGQIKDIISQHRKMFPFKLASEMVMSTREVHARPGEYVVEDITKLAGLDAEYFVRLLHAEGQYVSTRIVNGEAVSYCDEAGLLHMDGVVASNGHYSRYAIAEKLGTDLNDVRNLMSRSYKDAPYAEMYDRVPRGKSVRKQRQYNYETFESVTERLTDRPLRKLPSETQATEIVAQTGRDSATVSAYFERAGIPKEKRTVAGVHGAVDCYDLTPEQVQQAVTELRGVYESVPKDGSYIPVSRIRDRLRRHIALSTDELVALLPEQFGPKKFYSHNRTATFIPKESVEAAIEYLFAELKKPQQKNVRTLLDRPEGDTSDILLHELARLSGQAPHNLRRLFNEHEVLMTGEEHSQRVAYDKAILWLGRQLGAEPLPDNVKEHFVQINRTAMRAFLPRDRRILLGENQAVAQQAGVQLRHFLFRQSDATRVRDYVAKEDYPTFMATAEAYYTEKYGPASAPSAAPDKVSISDIAAELRLSEASVAAIGEFVVGKRKITDIQHAKLHELISKAMRQLKIAAPKQGTLGVAATRAIFSRVVMLAEPELAIAIEQDTRIRGALRKESGALAATNAALKQQGQETTTDTRTNTELYTVQRALITEWASLQQVAQSLAVSPQAMKQVMIECRPRHGEITSSGTAVQLSASLQIRCKAYVIAMKRTGLA